jgi:hypothetical protein
MSDGGRRHRAAVGHDPSSGVWLSHRGRSSQQSRAGVPNTTAPRRGRHLCGPDPIRAADESSSPLPVRSPTPWGTRPHGRGQSEHRCCSPRMQERGGSRWHAGGRLVVVVLDTLVDRCRGACSARNPVVELAQGSLACLIAAPCRWSDYRSCGGCPFGALDVRLRTKSNQPLLPRWRGLGAQAMTETSSVQPGSPAVTTPCS